MDRKPLLAFPKLEVALMLNFAEKPHLELTFKEASQRRRPSAPLASLAIRSGFALIAAAGDAES